MDCLDRTNVAQFVLGLHALELQLHALGISESPFLDIRSSMATELMNLYEQMGNTLAKQVPFLYFPSLPFSALQSALPLTSNERGSILLKQTSEGQYTDTGMR